MQSLKSPYTLYNQQSVGSTLHNNLLFITYTFLQTLPHGNALGVRLYPSHCRVDSGLAPVRTCARRAH